VLVRRCTGSWCGSGRCSSPAPVQPRFICKFINATAILPDRGDQSDMHHIPPGLVVLAAGLLAILAIVAALPRHPKANAWSFCTEADLVAPTKRPLSCRLNVGFSTRQPPIQRIASSRL
jgi:hypothetical protein